MDCGRNARLGKDRRWVGRIEQVDGGNWKSCQGGTCPTENGSRLKTRYSGGPQYTRSEITERDSGEMVKCEKERQAEQVQQIQKESDKVR